MKTFGRYRYEANAHGYKFRPTPLLVNITPDVRFGQENEIALGGGNWHDRFSLREGDF